MSADERPPMPDQRAEPTDNGDDEIADCAAKFDAAEMELFPLDGRVLVLEAQDFVALLPYLRMAWATCSKTKPELLEVVKSLTEPGTPNPDEALFDMMEWLDDAENKLTNLAKLAATGKGRLYLAFGKTLHLEASQS